MFEVHLCLFQLVFILYNSFIQIIQKILFIFLSRRLPDFDLLLFFNLLFGFFHLLFVLLDHFLAEVASFRQFSFNFLVVREISS